MNKRVITYARTSTEEQSRHSIEQQFEALKRYCVSHNYTLVEHFNEHCSAKDFNRPVFKDMYEFAKRHRKSVDALLVLRFDRFGRNIIENFTTIKKFQSLGIEVNSIEDPIDFSSPEHKILMSLFFSVSEVERDKISLRTQQNMDFSRKSGYWCGTAPYGYSNFRDSNGKSTLIPNDDSKMVRLFFDEYAKGIYSIDQVRHKLTPLGLRRSRNSCMNLVNNPVYIGKILIRGERKQDSVLVEGLHPAIIDESVFDTCQRIIKKNYRPPVLKTSQIDDAMPLRGFIMCPLCHKLLTGSFSKGGDGVTKHPYIHCNPPCRVRYKSVELHQLFERLLFELSLKEDIKKTYRSVLKKSFDTNREEALILKESLLREKSKIENRIDSLHNKYLDDDLDKNSYIEMNRKLTLRFDEINFELEKFHNQDKNFEKHLAEGISFLHQIDNVYREASTFLKKKIVASLFPEKLYFEKDVFLAPKMDEITGLILDLDKVTLLKIRVVDT